MFRVVSNGISYQRRVATASFAVAAACAAWSAVAEPIRVDAETGAATWEVQSHGVTVSLTQLLPDQVRAFYVNRGFELADADVFAEACVFMAVLRNDAAPGELEFRLSDWQVEYGGQNGPQVRAIPPLDGWLTQWQAREVPAPAQLAFRWAQFPAEQRYAPGEWNQGMLAVGLAPRSRFDLIARWTVADQTFEGRLDDILCTE